MESDIVSGLNPDFAGRLRLGYPLHAPQDLLARDSFSMRSILPRTSNRNALPFIGRAHAIQAGIRVAPGEWTSPATQVLTEPALSIKKAKAPVPGIFLSEPERMVPALSAFEWRLSFSGFNDGTVVVSMPACSQPRPKRKPVLS